MRELAIVAVIALTFSAFTLWLIDSWIKYPLFLFETLVITTLYCLITDNYELRITFRLVSRLKLNRGLIIDATLISTSIILLALGYSSPDRELILAFLALLCTSLLPGYALLNISGLVRYFTKLERLLLSYILSYIYTGLLFFVFLPISESLRKIIILSSYIVLGVLSAVKHLRNSQAFMEGSFTRKIDIFAILLSTTFYTLSFYFIYPGVAFLPGTDISRHYAWSTTLSRTPDIYIGSTYLLAHLHEAAFICFSNASLPVIQTTLVMLNIMLPIAFYVMAKAYLEKLDTRLPSLATLFWTLFTNSYGGFAWLYFLKLKILSSEQTQLRLLIATADKTYNGTIYGIFGLWYVPATVSFVILMTAVSLMSKKDIKEKEFLAIFSILIAALYLTHVVEAMVLILFFTTLALILGNKCYRVDDTLKSSIIGMGMVSIIYYLLSQITPRFIMNASLLVSLIVPILIPTIVLISRQYIHFDFSRIKNKFHKKSTGEVLVIVLFFVYCIAFLSWTTFLETLSHAQISTIGLVPWFMYPIIFGINGLLAIPALYFLVKKSKNCSQLILFIIFMVVAFIIGRIITVINLYFFDVGYWEHRFIWFIKISLAILAPITIVYAIDKLGRINLNGRTRVLASVIMVGIIVLYGVSTTFLNIEYWNIIANDPSRRPSQNEIEALNVLKKIFDSDSKAFLVTLTKRSSDTATLATPPDQPLISQHIYTAYRPEIVFVSLYRHPIYSHAYLYLHNRDLAELNKFADRFLANYIKILPLIYGNPEVRIYNVSKVSPPLPNGDAVLVLPLERLSHEEQTLYAAYSLLSPGLYNYTVTYDLDDKIFNSKTIVLAYDPPEGNILQSFFKDSFDGTLASYTIIKGSWRITDGELFGGETGKHEEGIILLPIFAENFTASFKVKPISGSTSAINYVSLIYSWKDPKNYRAAEIMFNTDSYIYVHFKLISNGVENRLPNWLGIKTDLTWNFGNEYNITVVVNGTLSQIMINGRTYLSMDLENTPGEIGLRYHRFYQISFDELSLAYTASLNLRPVEDYLDFLKSGGRLIVLNTNGYHVFANLLFSIKNSTTVDVNRIESGRNVLDLPTKISTLKLVPKSSNIVILSRYTGSYNETPLIVKQEFGNGELFYVNIRPIIEVLYRDRGSMCYYILGDLLEDLNLQKIESNFIFKLDGYVKQILLWNGVNVETSSLIFPPNLMFKEIRAKTGTEDITLFNVTVVRILDYSKLLIKTESLTIDRGRGFYAALKLNDTFVIESHEDIFGLEVVVNNTKHYITHVNQVLIVPYESIQLLARTPNISANKTTFIEFYTFGSLNWRTRTFGQNLNVDGRTNFQVILSDNYTALDEVRLGKYFKREPPIVMFNELSTIPIATFWALLLLPIFAGLFFIFMSRQQDMRE